MHVNSSNQEAEIYLIHPDVSILYGAFSLEGKTLKKSGDRKTISEDTNLNYLAQL